MKEFAAVITIDIPVLIMAENKDAALQKAVAVDTDYLIKRIQDRNCINIRVPCIREISADLENTKDAKK